jgi:16S rRNA (guanine527-N7)-methyltransferase
MNGALATQLTATLRQGAAQLRVDLTDAAVDAMIAYLDVLGRWNRRFNLTAIRDPERMVVEHLLDALTINHALQGDRLIDVGTGAGLPGLVLAIARPQLSFTLLDANGKKTRFLREAVRVLGAGNVEIVTARCEDYRPGAGFDTVMCRAFAPLPRLVADAGHLRGPGGVILAQKGLYPDDEIAQLGDGWQVESTTVSVPGLDKTRHLLFLRPTPTP